MLTVQMLRNNELPEEAMLAVVQGKRVQAGK